MSTSKKDRESFLTRFSFFCFMTTLIGSSDGTGWNDTLTSTLLKDLQAECSIDGIHVKLWFKKPFSGVAYSKGHYETSQCRYISQEDDVFKRTSGTNYSFLIPVNECGTVHHGTHSPSAKHRKDARDDNNTMSNGTKPSLRLHFYICLYPVGNQVYIENTLLIQNDPTIQEAGDFAKTLRCVWQQVFHKPLKASLPFRNANSRIESTRISPSTHSHTELSRPSVVKQQNRTSSKSRRRFQQKGQVHTVTVPAFIRHYPYYTRSLNLDVTNDTFLVDDPSGRMHESIHNNKVSSVHLLQNFPSNLNEIRAESYTSNGSQISQRLNNVLMIMISLGYRLR